ncbi:hypothetical protein AWV79_35760 [Cupriavidus sp. UYMMa02A]|nr:hypothetical protein AWV79_35760 [Cupriavidus sp. UYMMa02A]
MEALIAGAIAIVMSLISLGSAVGWSKVGTENVQNAATANQLMTFDKAAMQYVQDNGVAIASLATPTTPVTITPAMLKASGYLATGFSDTNVFQQTWQAQVLQPTAGQLQTLVTSQGGQPIQAKQLVQIASLAGAQGGFIPYNSQAGDSTMNANTAYGARGAWTQSMANYANPGSGRLASLLAFTNLQSTNGYLYRVQVPNHPELNRAQTSIDMGANDLNNVRAVTAQTGSISGDLGVGGTAWVGNVRASSDVTGNYVAGNYVRSNGDVSVQNNMVANGAYANYLHSWGSATIQGALNAQSVVNMNPVAWAGWGCGGTQITVDPNGVPLYCNGGQWRQAAGGGVKNYADFDWFAGYGTFGTGLPYWNWSCALSRVGGKYAGGGESVQVVRDGGSGTWVVIGSSGSDNSGAFARVTCVQLS